MLIETAAQQRHRLQVSGIDSRTNDPKERRAAHHHSMAVHTNALGSAAQLRNGACGDAKAGEPEQKAGGAEDDQQVVQL